MVKRLHVFTCLFIVALFIHYALIVPWHFSENNRFVECMKYKYPDQDKTKTFDQMTRTMVRWSQNPMQCMIETSEEFESSLRPSPNSEAEVQVYFLIKTVQNDWNMRLV